jgi:hypothetical protein
MKLVENWRDCWKWFSVRALAAIGLLPAVWMMLPEDLRAYVPATWLPWIAAAVALGGLVGRMVDQTKAQP